MDAYHEICVPKIGEPTTSWCLISRTVGTNAMVDHWSFSLQAAINRSHSSLHIPAVCCMVCWRLITAIWIYSHSIACCFLFLLPSVLQMIVQIATCVLFSVAASAASRWTNWCVCCCCVPLSAALDAAPVDRLISHPLSPCWGVSVALICYCGIEQEDDNEMKWEVLRNK